MIVHTKILIIRSFFSEQIHFSPTILFYLTLSRKVRLSGEFSFIILHTVEFRLLQVAASTEVKLISFKESRCRNSSLKMIMATLRKWTQLKVGLGIFSDPLRVYITFSLYILWVAFSILGFLGKEFLFKLYHCSITQIFTHKIFSYFCNVFIFLISIPNQYVMAKPSS